jgi:hypothetical protein
MPRAGPLVRSGVSGSRGPAGDLMLGWPPAQSFVLSFAVGRSRGLFRCVFIAAGLRRT